MSHFQFRLVTLLALLSAGAAAQNIEDDFEGNGNISTWFALDCAVNPNFANPVAQGLNTSTTVLQYFDYGGLWGNIYFDANHNFNIAAHPQFSFKIYVPTSSITGNQENKVILKLQNSNIIKPWESQALISKPIVLDQWQVVNFDFSTDPTINFDPNSPAPVDRTDFNRVLIQVNGEFNTDMVVAYIDDFFHAYYTPVPPPTVYDQLIWSDEFNTDGAVDESKWFHQTIFPVGNSWFSGEIQHYTDRVDNSYVEDGILNVVALKESFTNQGVTKQYTSARLNSKIAFKYGRVEFRANLPAGVGTWPAIWMLGKNINENGAYWQTQGFGTAPWPDCGEMDIMEHWGADQNIVISAIHNPSTFIASPGNVINGAGQFIPTASADFHVYALEWTAEKLVFSTDGVVHYTYQPAVKNTDNWPFDAEQYILMNVAILPSIHPAFTQSALQVDYIRIYGENMLGIADNGGNANIKAFPNPVDALIRLELNTTLNGPVTFDVFNMGGYLVYSTETNVENGNAQLKDLNALPNGLYVITYAKDGLSETIKFVK